MKLNWNFLGEGGGGTKQKLSVGGVWIFSGNAHCPFLVHLYSMVAT